MSLRLAPVAVARIVEPFGQRELEMHRLAGEWPEAGGDEEQPGEQFRTIVRRPQELTSLPPR